MWEADINQLVTEINVKFCDTDQGGTWCPGSVRKGVFDLVGSQGGLPCRRDSGTSTEKWAQCVSREGPAAIGSRGFQRTKRR